jgi:hypothetical protein
MMRDFILNGQIGDGAYGGSTSYRPGKLLRMGMQGKTASRPLNPGI